MAADQSIVRLLLSLVLTLGPVSYGMRWGRDIHRILKMAAKVTVLHSPFLGCGRWDSLSKGVAWQD